MPNRAHLSEAEGDEGVAALQARALHAARKALEADCAQQPHAQQRARPAVHAERAYRRPAAGRLDFRLFTLQTQGGLHQCPSVAACCRQQCPWQCMRSNSNLGMHKPGYFAEQWQGQAAYAHAFTTTGAQPPQRL